MVWDVTYIKVMQGEKLETDVNVVKKHDNWEEMLQRPEVPELSAFSESETTK